MNRTVKLVMVNKVAHCVNVWTSPPHRLKFLDGRLSTGWLGVGFRCPDPTYLASNSILLNIDMLYAVEKFLSSAF